MTRLSVGEFARSKGIDSILISSLPGRISGKIGIEYGRYVVRVNRHESYYRQRFTIIFETMFFVMNKEIVDNSPKGISHNTLYRSGDEESSMLRDVAAWKKAAERIAPRKEIGEMWNRYSDRSEKDRLEILSLHFGVMPGFMRNRIHDFVPPGLPTPGISTKAWPSPAGINS